jgi:predicted HAD superfamily Cof-like phosphohydrolase
VPDGGVVLALPERLASLVLHWHVRLCVDLNPGPRRIHGRHDRRQVRPVRAHTNKAMRCSEAHQNQDHQQGREMNDMQDMVQRFHETYGHPVGETPRAIPPEQVDLRIKLIKEEFNELIEALEKGDIVETYDASLDILYVVFGLLTVGGMDAEPGFAEVQASNMSKLGADGLPILSRGEELDGFPEGKVLKGPNYFKPDLLRVLIAQGYIPEEPTA